MISAVAEAESLALMETVLDMKEKLTGVGPKDNQRKDWESRYRVGDVPWDRGRAAPAIEEAGHFFPDGAKILVPGCGYGHDAAGLSRSGYRVEGWDISPSAIEKARKTYQRDDLTFSCRDLLNSGKEGASFDGIFEHTFLCAIGPVRWKEAIKEFARLLRPNGYLFAVLFTEMAEDDPPPWPIEPSQAKALLGTYFKIDKISPAKKCFPGRENEESLWQMRLL